VRDLLPRCVAVAVAETGDWDGTAHPAELGMLGERTTPVRRREFIAGRACSRRALAALGHHDHPVLVGRDRAPLWPPGVVGSITHTKGYCAAAAVRTDTVRALGIDAEEHLPLEPGVTRVVCRPEELDRCASGDPAVHWPTVIFSGKEAVYKLWSPLVGTWLDFHDVALELAPATGKFTARISPARLIAGAPPAVSGRFAVRNGLVLTAALLPH
jgi:4'-phosphopantetheinyl transferase EntD